MWDPGNSSRFGPGLGSRRSVPHCRIQTASRQLGFTLLELLLVVAIIAIASAGVGFALREQDETQLEREGQRLVALLESARAQSRATGLPVYWRAEARGFAFVGLAPVAPPADAAPMNPNGAAQPALTPWLTDGTTVEDGAALMLGPEPIIAPQQVVLLLGERSLRIATDGLRPFAVRTPGADQPADTTP